jgi:hypothetical protein
MFASIILERPVKHTWKPISHCTHTVHDEQNVPLTFSCKAGEVTLMKSHNTFALENPWAKDSDMLFEYT